MSERGSFTTQYIYNWDDYQTIRNVLDQRDKYLCVSPPAYWSNGSQYFEMPIVSGKVGETGSNMEWMTIEHELEGVKTNKEVKVVVMCDAGSIILVTKKPNGDVDLGVLEKSKEIWE